MAKYTQCAEILERRIHEGVYPLRDLPTEQGFAEELGTTRKTARRALQHLMEKGVLTRKPYGRIEINPMKTAACRLVLLVPAFASNQYMSWHEASRRVANAYHADVHLVPYTHWEDPAISRALSSHDGVMLVPSSASIPPLVLQRFADASNLVVLDGDLTAWGVPSVQSLPAMFIHRLGDHLYELGHRRIVAFNVQPHDQTIRPLIEQWRNWCALHQVECRLVDEPVEAGEEALPQAVCAFNAYLDSGPFEATGMVGMTLMACRGAIRALHEHGLRAPDDVSVCATSPSQYDVPSITGLIGPSPDRYLDVCVRWLAGPDRPWSGALLLHPTDIQVFAGESTGPVPANDT